MLRMHSLSTMWLHVLLVGLVVTFARAFASGAIRWGGHGTKRFILGPTRANFLSSAPVPAEKLVVRDAFDGKFPSVIPYFTAKPGGTITWDAMGWCIEASGTSDDDAVRMSQCTGGPNQKWTWLQSGSGPNNHIQLQSTSKCLSVVHAEAGLSVASVALRECANIETESWRFERIFPQTERSALSFIIPSAKKAIISIAALGMLSISAWVWLWQMKARVRDVRGRGICQGGIGLSAASMTPAMMALNPTSGGAALAAMDGMDLTPGEKTLPLYHEDTFCFLSSARLQSVTLSNDDLLSVVLDQTIFHPQGGGQPTDVGVIKADGLPTLTVCKASLDKATGIVNHECKCDALKAWTEAPAGMLVNLFVDETVRRSNARIHSAGHLIDAAVAKAGFEWTAGKGYHFPDSPYVEYVMTAEQKSAVNKDEALPAINDALQNLLASPTPFRVDMRDGVRTVEIENASCPCGGTHVNDTSQLGKVIVTRLKAKGKNMRVSYRVEPN